MPPPRAPSPLLGGGGEGEGVGAVVEPPPPLPLWGPAPAQEAPTEPFSFSAAAPVGGLEDAAAFFSSAPLPAAPHIVPAGEATAEAGGGGGGGEQQPLAAQGGEAAPPPPPASAFGKLEDAGGYADFF